MVEGNDRLASECLGHEVHQKKDASRHLTAPDEVKNTLYKTLKDEKQPLHDKGETALFSN